jgi:KaiC/GvpD/RAD55 family RecA-like ATPase
MPEQDIILKNSLKLLKHDIHKMLQEGGLGAVFGRAGLGKTAFLVQVALNTLLSCKNVLHISLNDPVKKISLWYKEVFNNMAKASDADQTGIVWDMIVSRRFIMTFKVEGFSVPKLNERLTDITEQNIFLPDLMIIDGMPFDDSTREMLMELKDMAETNSLSMWFTVTSHRHEQPDSQGVPVQLQDVLDLFDAAIQLQPNGKAIQVNMLKGPAESERGPHLILDPSTMLLKDKN